MYSFDIEKMYIDIPTRYATNIINNILESNPEININIKKEILHIVNSVGTKLLPI
jgi:hypothetical protein